MRHMLDRLAQQQCLSWKQWHTLLTMATSADRQYAASMAFRLTRAIFGHQIYYRGIVEFTNHCRCNCRYCGIRKGNAKLQRYRLSSEEIVDACATGYSLGVRTFVLQGGEDPWYTDERLVPLIASLNEHFPQAAITLSLGERSQESYKNLYAAGARRYLLRHETANPSHYRQLHTQSQSFWRRMNCLYALREEGYQVGCGMMVGSPGQGMEQLADDMVFLQEFRPEMLGIGPFLPHHATPFHACPPGRADLTLFLLSLCRLMLPAVLLPATTALRTLLPRGLARGVEAGCNVVMPSMTSQTKGYALYDGKVVTQNLAATLHLMEEEVVTTGCTLTSARGDYGYESQPESENPSARMTLSCEPCE